MRTIGTMGCIGHVYRHWRRVTGSPAAKYRGAFNVLYNKFQKVGYHARKPFFGTIEVCASQICVPMDTKANSLLDITKHQNDAVEVGTVTFTADQGWSNFSTSNYINSQVAENDPNSNWGPTLNHMWMYRRTRPVPSGTIRSGMGARQTKSSILYSFMLHGSDTGTYVNETVTPVQQSNTGHSYNGLGFWGYHHNHRDTPDSVVQTRATAATFNAVNNHPPSDITTDVYIGVVNQDGSPVEPYNGQISAWGFGADIAEVFDAFNPSDGRKSIRTQLNQVQEGISAYMSYLGTAV